MKCASLAISIFPFYLFILSFASSHKNIPAVRWGQNCSSLTIIVLIPSIKEETVKFEKENIHVTATDLKGENFELNLNTLRDINPTKSSYQLLKTGLKLKVYKEIKEPCWKYLTKKKKNEKFIRDKALGDADDCENAKEIWFDEYKHHVKLQREGRVFIQKGDPIEDIIAKLQKQHPSFSVHEY